MEKIRRVSLFFKVIFQIMFISIPIILVISWIYAPDQLLLFSGIINWNAIPANYSGMHIYTTGTSEKSILHTLTFDEKILGFLVSSIPMIVYLFILAMLIKLFSCYEKKEIFSINNIRYICNIGYALLISQIIEPFYQFTMGIVLTIHNPPHHRFASITLDQTNVGILLTALLVILISWIMAEAYQLREEQQLTI